MIFRAVVDFMWHDQRGNPDPVQKGELVDVLMQVDADRLLAEGKITFRDLSHADPWGMALGKPADPRSPVKRIGIWMFTSSGYSGGRIHIYQYANALAQNGCQVFIITNQHPKWADDYPQTKNLRILIERRDAVPPDIDLIMTDSKDSIGMNALIYKRTHPNVPFVCMNFETPNWVAKYDAEYAKHLNVNKDVFKYADLFLANSHLSRKYLLEWMEQSIPCGVLPPVVNTHALDQTFVFTHNQLDPSRPFAIWSSRSPKYKGGHVALDAVLALDQPFDLVTFGAVEMGDRVPGNNHKIVQLKGANDKIKYAAYRAAHMTLAPSKFEGFGMVPAESLASGTQCLVYDLPVLRQEYGGVGEGLIYVPWGDERAFKQKVREVASKPKPKIKQTAIHIQRKMGLDSMVKRIEMLPYHHFKAKKISCHLVAYWGFVPESLESIYPYVDEIFIAFGRCPHAEEIDDGSWERLQDFPDPDKKIKLENRDYWSGGKEEMRTWAVSQATGNYMLLLDGDEIWVGLDKWIESGIQYGCPRWLNFWHSDKHWIHDTAKLAGMRWGKQLDPFGSVCPHYRWSWWRSSYSFMSHHALPKDTAGEGMHLRTAEISEQVPEAVIYHLGHALPKDVMAAKHAFYLGRDGDDPGRRARRDKWINWNSQEGDCGDGIVSLVDWKLPGIVQRGFASLNRNQIRVVEAVV